MIRRRWLLVALVLFAGCALRIDIRLEKPTPRVPTTYVASVTGNDAAGTPCTDAAPCSIRRALLTAVCGDTVELLPGVYRGSNYMIDTVTNAPATPTCTAGSPLTVRARSETAGGGVFIDGQFARAPFDLNSLTYWTFEGLDAGNAGPALSSNYALQIAGSSNLVMRRICVSNASHGDAVHSNGMVMGFYSSPSSNNTFEDFCVFGTGRNALVDSSNGTNNVLRRFWIRWEGWCHDGRMIMQAPYYSDTPTPTGGNSIYENFILVHDPEQQAVCSSSALSLEPHISRTPSLALTKAGFIIYGYPGFNSAGTQVKGAWVRDADSSTGCVPGGCLPLYAGSHIRHWKDFFIDTRAQTSVAHAAIALSCDPGLPYGSTCSSNSADRLTAIINSGNDASSFTWANRTNTNECTSLDACPNFYTGTLGGASGARNCFEYTNGVLGSNPATQGLWPWRMDDRIKAALARARAADTGGSALQGGAGSGYAAGTVTSEIASRYGAIPAACSRTTTVFTPDFPVVTDFPSTPVIDTFDRANGPLGSSWSYLAVPNGFTITSNQAAASAATRALYSASLLPAQHEAYATWTTVPNDGTESTLVLFSATTTDDTTGWHLILQRVASGNDRLKIARITGGYTETYTVDLGGKVADGNLFGVRVSPLQTISVYWRYNGVTYRVGSVIDTNLPSTANQMIGLGGGAGASVVINDFGGTSTGGITPNPGNIGRFGARFPTP